jgi:hypothetical protein
MAETQELVKPEQQIVSTHVTAADVEQLKQQRETLAEFVRSQLREAQFSDDSRQDFGEGDYGIIPGTKKKALLKPGAEKLLRLFGLGVRIKLTDKDVDLFANFAMFIYSAEVYSLKTGVTISQCEGSTNSQEKKYRERSVWRTTGKDSKGKPIRECVTEPTPVADILNTLIKMAQKRAIVGATIMATAASDYFYPDIESARDAEQTGMKTAVEDPKTEKPVEAQVETPPNCDLCKRPMMISRYPNRDTGELDWYCAKDRKSKPRVQS